MGRWCLVLCKHCCWQLHWSHACDPSAGVDIGQQIRQLRGGVDVAVGTPGRFIDLINRGNLDLSMVSFWTSIGTVSSERIMINSSCACY